MELLKRTQEVLARKRDAPVSLANALHEIGKFYLEKEDPLEKAERASKKYSKADPLIRGRQKAQVRDHGKCQYRMKDGAICGSKHWTDLHHVRPKSEGGTDASDNLITLCSSHHRMVHAPPN